MGGATPTMVRPAGLGALADAGRTIVEPTPETAPRLGAGGVGALMRCVEPAAVIKSCGIPMMVALALLAGDPEVAAGASSVMPPSIVREAGLGRVGGWTSDTTKPQDGQLETPSPTPVPHCGQCAMGSNVAGSLRLGTTRQPRAI